MLLFLPNLIKEPSFKSRIYISQSRKQTCELPLDCVACQDGEEKKRRIQLKHVLQLFGALCLSSDRRHSTHSVGHTVGVAGPQCQHLQQHGIKDTAAGT